WGKLLGLAAEIHAQPRAEASAKPVALELVRTPASNESKSSNVMDFSPFAPLAPVDRFLPQPQRAPSPPPSAAYDILSLRIDPSQVRRPVAIVDTIPARPETTEADVRAIDSSFTAKPDPQNKFAELSRFATQEDLEEAKHLARLINPSRWAEIYVRFADELL